MIIRLLFASILALGLVGIAPADALAHDPPNEEIRELTEELAQRPGDVELLLRRAELWLREHHPEDAERDLDRVDRSGAEGDQLVRTALLRADVWRQRGHLERAERALDDAVATGALEARVARAEIRAAAHLWIDALVDYEAAINRQLTVELALGHGRALEALGRWEDAAASYRRAIERLGGATVIRLARVAALRRLARWDDALVEVDALMGRSRATARWQLLRATILREAGRPAEAREARERALLESQRLLRLRPSPAARLVHARVLRALDRREEARRELLRVCAESTHLAPEAETLLHAMEGSR